MRVFTFILLGLAILATASPGQVSGTQKSAWLSFSGGCFDIKYPAGFKPHPSLPTEMVCSEKANKRASAFFASPDNSVEFYVYAPMTDPGDEIPADIRVNTLKETLVAQEKQESKDEIGSPIIVRQFTIKAKDKSYTRSYVDRSSGESPTTRTVFGIKYMNQQAYDKYKQDYLKFKKSLTLYWWD